MIHQNITILHLVEASLEALQLLQFESMDSIWFQQMKATGNMFVWFIFFKFPQQSYQSTTDNICNC